MLDMGKLYDVVGGNNKMLEQPDEDIIQRLRFDDSLQVPIELTDLDMWSNYVNEDLYAMDVKLREFFKKTRYRRERNGGYRTTASVVFAWIYGRKPTPADSGACRMLHELLRYYCTSYTGLTTYHGKKVNRVYEFSKYATYCRRPYSLKLRLEESDGQTNIWRQSHIDPTSKRRHGRREHREVGVDGHERRGHDSRGEQVDDRSGDGEERS